MLTDHQFDAWVTALKTEQYHQAHGRYEEYTRLPDGSKSVSYCVLGLLAHLNDKNPVFFYALFSQKKYGVADLAHHLTRLNDGIIFTRAEMSFPELAIWIEAHRALFVDESVPHGQHEPD